MNHKENKYVKVMYSNKTIYFISVYHIRSLIEYYNYKR